MIIPLEDLLIDEEDKDRVSLFKWRKAKSQHYIFCRIDRQNVLLHRFIMGADSFKKDFVVDHINRNKIDNRKSNLRLTSALLNNHNKGIDKRNKTGCSGVQKTRWNSYRACIGYNKKTIDLGSHKTLEEAIKVRREAELKYWGQHNLQ